MKKENLKELSVEELEERLRSMRESLFHARLANTAKQRIKNPLIIRSTRRQIARALTFIRQKKG